MFERFTEQARRAIFFARYEASEAAHSEIGTQDLLNGLGHDWPALCQALSLPVSSFQASGRKAKARGVWWTTLFRKRVPHGVEMPFSKASKSALQYAMEFADGIKSAWIGRRHLLMGVAKADQAIAESMAAKNLNPAELPLPAGEDWLVQGRGPGSIGIGYDYHRLEAGRKLIVGGVEIPFAKGLAGHSDGDVLTHAICDALLGAAGLGDIGQHFPDTDPRWKGVNSLALLAQVVDMIGEKGWRVAQIDSVILAEEPKLAPYFSRMRETLAKTLGADPAEVNVKAKTTEGLEAVGRGEAMAAQAVASLDLKERRGRHGNQMKRSRSA